jgi:L-alanine-DL-glutamate epimerase-like enolase superfamily enzyme
LNTVAYGNVSIKAAVETALYDLYARVLDVPVYSLLGGGFRRRIETIGLLGAEAPERDVEEIEGLLERGLGTIKIKVGGAWKSQLKRIETIRKELGYGFKVRLDANQAWSRRDAVSFVSGLEGLDVELFEQPVHRDDISGMKKVREVSPAPISADESLISVSSAVRLAYEGACDLFNVKMLKMGLYASKIMEAIASASHLSTFVGAGPELGVGTASTIHLSASIRALDHACEIAHEDFYGDDVIEGKIDYIGGKVEVPKGPGLGVSLDKEKLKKYCVKSVKL